MKRTIGVDEVGRGPLAGPVVAAAVIFCDVAIAGIDDSKRLSARRRVEVAQAIRENAWWGLGWVWPREIDKINIHNASLLAMSRAIATLNRRWATAGDGAQVDEIVVDGRFTPKEVVPFGEPKGVLDGVAMRAVIGGDGLIAEVGAASIVAKVARDAWMTSYDRADGRYDFAQHKGYPTRLHLERLARFGPCPIHRRSFAPVAQLSLFGSSPSESSASGASLSESGSE